MYEEICTYENILEAFEKARENKNKKYYVIKFKRKLKENLEKLQKELISETYKPSPLKVFIVRDPKTRTISKSRFKDRVVHHVLMNVIGPIFEKRFIHDSHANQLGKGTLKAVQRFNVFKRKVSKNGSTPCFVLKADIKHYFAEVNHEVLLEIIRRDIKDERVISLIKKILQNSDSARNRGGGQTTFGYAIR